MNKLTVGQTVIIESQNRRGLFPDGVHEETVLTVGKKFFTITGSRERFYIDTLKHDGGEYSSAAQAWLSLDEYNAAHEINRKYDVIHAKLRARTSMTNEQIEAIYKILNP